MMIRRIPVMIFPAGAELALELHCALGSNLHVELFGVSGKPDHAKFVYDAEHYYEDGLLYVTRPDFLARFNEVIDRFGIEYIYPAHDTVTAYLAGHADEIHARVLTSPFATALLAREKKRTYEVFAPYDFCPGIFSSPDGVTGFPVFLKPNTGQGGSGTLTVADREQLESALKDQPELLICEFLPGDELSVDCFTNKNRELLFIGPRTRERVLIGKSFQSVAVPVDDEVRCIAETINLTLVIQGAWFFQVKKDVHGRYKLMEFAVRQSTGMGLYRQRGVNFALLTLFDAMGFDVRVIDNKFGITFSRFLQNRYVIDFSYSTAYIDFDDTIVINGKVNETDVRFVYKCLNEGRKVILLTRHQSDIYRTLKTYRIDPDLFDRIIHIGPSEDKTGYINPEYSIFIDNYFFDREKVAKNLGIPVFDVDAIECLL